MASENAAGVEIDEAAEPLSAGVVDDRLIDELVSRAQAESFELTGPVGCCGEWDTGRLGCGKDDPAGENGG